jgi:cysteine desulfurase/selenocysteine lyase
MSGHKMLGPAGTGVLAVSDHGADLLRPARPGGGNVEYVGNDDHVYKSGPEAFELGSPNPEGVIGLAAAVSYLDKIGVDRISTHVQALTAGLRAGIADNKAFRLHFPPGHRNTGIVTFSPSSAMDVGLMGEILSETFKIALRHGHHCAQPFYRRMQAPPALRASMHLYNTAADVGRLLIALNELSTFCLT